MASDRGRLEESVAAVVDPVIGLPLGETGMIRAVVTRRHRAEVEVAVPADDWPGLSELVAAVESAALAADGVREAGVVAVTMDEDERNALRIALRGAGVAANDVEAGDEHPVLLG